MAYNPMEEKLHFYNEEKNTEEKLKFIYNSINWNNWNAIKKTPGKWAEDGDENLAFLAIQTKDEKLTLKIISNPKFNYSIDEFKDRLKDILEIKSHFNQEILKNKNIILDLGNNIFSKIINLFDKKRIDENLIKNVISNNIEEEIFKKLNLDKNEFATAILYSLKSAKISECTTKKKIYDTMYARDGYEIVYTELSLLYYAVKYEMEEIVDYLLNNNNFIINGINPLLASKLETEKQYRIFSKILNSPKLENPGSSSFRPTGYSNILIKLLTDYYYLQQNNKLKQENFYEKACLELLDFTTSDDINSIAEVVESGRFQTVLQAACATGLNSVARKILKRDDFKHINYHREPRLYFDWEILEEKEEFCSKHAALEAINHNNFEILDDLLSTSKIDPKFLNIISENLKNAKQINLDLNIRNLDKKISR